MFRGLGLRVWRLAFKMVTGLGFGADMILSRLGLGTRLDQINVQANVGVFSVCPDPQVRTRVQRLGRAFYMPKFQKLLFAVTKLETPAADLRTRIARFGGGQIYKSNLYSNR